MLFRGAKWTTSRILDRINGRRVKLLELHDTHADDDLLRALAEVGSLNSLDISSPLITDSGVGVLVRKCGLQSLLFRDAPLVTDRGLREIVSCLSLKTLSIEGTAVTDDGIGLVGKMPELCSLDISRTKITDGGLRRIASKRIDLISFNDVAVTGEGFSTWSVAEKMSLYTKQSSLNDEGFAVACRAFPYLWNLVMESTAVTNTGLRALEGQSPTMIRINGSRIDRFGVLWLIENTEAQSIEADPSQFSRTEAEKYKDYNGRYLRIDVY